MPTIKVEIKGLDELAKAFVAGSKALEPAMNRFIKKATLQILGASRVAITDTNAVDTGFLRHQGMQTTFGNLKGRIRNTAPYAIFVHEGTRFMKARPFFEMGINAVKPNFAAELNKTIQFTLNAIKRG